MSMTSMSPVGASAHEAPTAADLLKVVVLEDDDLDAGYLTRLLERLWPGGVEIERYLTVSELEARLPTQHPAVVLTDLGLPDGVGLEVVKRVRAVSGVAPVIEAVGPEDGRKPRRRQWRPRSRSSRAAPVSVSALKPALSVSALPPAD